jgi:DNA-nicking Smr family endonuclease
MTAPKTEARRRVTTEAERALFHETLSDVKPLKAAVRPARAKKKLPPPPPSLSPFAAKPKAKAKPKLPAARDMPPEIGGHRAAPMKRGRLEPEARLDLHGMTQEAAHGAAARFLVRARANGARVVLVITGKSGVLNKQFKLWLAQGEFRPLVSGVSAAHKRHGGGGAYYVLLRKPPEARR